MSRKPLSERQQEAFDFICACIARDGNSPSIREIGEHMVIRTTNGVVVHLDALEKKGYITREAKFSRAIKVVGVRWEMVKVEVEGKEE